MFEPQHKDTQREKKGRDDYKDVQLHRSAKDLPVNLKCLTSVYKATVTASDGVVRTYMGSTDRQLKERLYEHRTDANNRSHRHHTNLAVYTWDKKV